MANKIHNLNILLTGKTVLFLEDKKHIQNLFPWKMIVEQICLCLPSYAVQLLFETASVCCITLALKAACLCGEVVLGETFRLIKSYLWT